LTDSHIQRENLARGIFEARYFVQVVMVDAIVDGPPRVVELLIVDEPSGLFVDGPRNGELHAKAVAVEARAFVAARDLREPVRRLEAELVHEPNVHGKGWSASPCTSPFQSNRAR